MSNGLSLKVVTIQYDAKFKKVDENIEYLTKLIDEKLESEKTVDVILLPEMCLTGYVFDNREEIDFYCESPVLEYEGEEQRSENKYCRSISFASQIAKKYDSYVVIGFPEKIHKKKDFNRHLAEKEKSSNYFPFEFNSEYRYYISAALISRKGNYIDHHRKHFITDYDKRWANEGDYFKKFELYSRENPFQPIPTTIAICLDACSRNYDGKNDDDKMELGNFCYREGIQLILFLCNWRIMDRSNTPNEEKILNLINEWAERFGPLTDNKTEGVSYLITSNRVGKEKGNEFAGSSNIIQLKPSVKLFSNLELYSSGALVETLKW